jgi:hypothetical protein
MRSEEFWDRYNRDFRPHLGARAETFAKIFEYLDRFNRPVGILETGCMREKGNWGGDGGSTFLFDTYAEFHPGTAVYSVDIDDQATSLCRANVSSRVTIHTGDSVMFLKLLAETPPPDLPHLDLLYLDSYDIDFNNPHPSAFHHIKELLVVSPLLRAETLLVVDDSPPSASGFFIAQNAFQPTSPVVIGGKGKYIAEYAEHIGAERYFVGYQCGWIKLRG